MAWIDSAQDRADFFLVFICGMKVFRIGSGALRANPCQHAFVVRAASLSAEAINSGADGDAIEPGFHTFMLSFRIAPQFQKNFHGEFFGTTTISDDALNDAGDSRVV